MNTYKGLQGMTEEDRASVIQKSVAVRRERLAIKYKLKSGALRAADVINNFDDKVVGGIRVYALLMALPAVGNKKAKQMLGEAALENKPISKLNSQEREVLLKLLEKY